MAAELQQSPAQQPPTQNLAPRIHYVNKRAATTFQRHGGSGPNNHYRGVMLMTALILLSKFRETEIEIWRQILEAPDYDVSSLGRIRSWRGKKSHGGRIGFYTVRLDIPRLMRTFPRSTKVPYPTVALQTPDGERQFHIHRLVAQYFITNLMGYPQVNHKNLIKSDSRAGNLEWCTHEQNHEHATVNGVRPRGEKHGTATVSDSLVRMIKLALRDTSLRHIDIAVQFGIKKHIVDTISSGQNWSHITID